MVVYCCVPLCNTAFKAGNNKKFHKFPVGKELRSKWIVAIKSDKQPSKYAVVCSDHFKSSDYEESLSGLTKVLNKDSIPSEKLPKRLHDKKPSKRRVLKRQYVAPSTSNSEKDENIVFEDPYNVTEVEVSCELFEEPCNSADCLKTYADIGTQTQTFKNFLYSTMHYENLNENEVKYFTGFDKTRIKLLFSVLDVKYTVYDCYLDPLNQLVLTLIKYRQAIDFLLISKLYQLHRNVISKIFSYWTEKIYIYLKKINFWSLSYTNSSTYTAIIDCTEILTERSSNDPNVNQELFSNYKSHNTFKYLVAIDEKGLITFCSSVYGGSKSDRYIIENSKFVDFLKPGDIILAHRGFNVSDILEQKQVALNIPPIKHNPQFSPHEVIETRVIANRRIHVERVINLAKKNKILSSTISASLWPQINEIIFNANMLCNFKSTVIKPEL